LGGQQSRFERGGEEKDTQMKNSKIYLCIFNQSINTRIPVLMYCFQTSLRDNQRSILGPGND